MRNDERLREALLELETLRGREAERLRESQALLGALEALTASENVDAGLVALLSSIEGSLGCDGVVLFESREDALVLRLPEPSRGAAPAWTAPGLLTRPRRIVDLQGVAGLWETPPPELSEWRALLSVPIADGETRMVLAAFDRAPGRFSAAEAELMERLAAIAGQAILRRALERRNAFLASVIDRSPTSVTIADVRGEMPLVYVNAAFVRLTGYERSEVLGRNCRVLTAEPPGSPVRADLRRTLAARGAGRFVVRNRRKDGSEFWNQLQIFPVEDESGTATHVVATQSDVTGQIEAERGRDEAQRRLEGALAATSEAFLILGRRGNVRFANAPFRALVGEGALERGAALPREIAGWLLDRPVPGPGTAVIDAFRRPASHELTAPDGRQVLVRARPIPDGGAVITASDVTQLKVADRALRQRVAAIERSQDGIAIGDAEGRLVDVNPSLLALWGLEDEEAALGRKWTRFYEPASVEAFLADAAAIRRTGAHRGEARTAAPDGPRTHELSLSLVPDVGSILVVRDVTDRLRDAAERDGMRRRLDRAQMQERLHQVSAGLAHDFNHLLSAILGSAALLEAAPGLDEGARGATGRITAAAGRAAELIEGLLDLGSRERTAEHLDLARVIASTVDLARAGAPSSARLTVCLPPAPVIVEASQTDLLQVVMNLVVNAIDALGGAQGEVRVTLRHGGRPQEGAPLAAGTPEPGRDYAAIEVEDTGAGMSPETLRQVLEPYFTTKGNAGTGLGLAIVASITGDAGGLLTVESREGEGTKFTVWWPLDRPEAPRHAAPDAPARDRSHLPILVLDDAAEVAASLAATLARAGYEVAETDDPVSAVETIAEDPGGWACLITDYDMPELSGGDVIERLGVAAPGLPVIVVSALARRLRDRRLAAARCVLQKPVRDDRLLRAVREATGRRDRDGVS